MAVACRHHSHRIGSSDGGRLPGGRQSPGRARRGAARPARLTETDPADNLPHPSSLWIAARSPPASPERDSLTTRTGRYVSQGKGKKMKRNLSNRWLLLATLALLTTGVSLAQSQAE